MHKIFWSGVFVFAVTAAVLGTDVLRGMWLWSWWIDIIEHGLGGILAGLIGMWWALALTKRATLTHALLGALVLGVLVEIVEYIFGVGISVHMSRSLDTTKDIVVNSIGGYLAWRYARRFV